jgi:hypothetical protein
MGLRVNVLILRAVVIYVKVGRPIDKAEGVGGGKEDGKGRLRPLEAGAPFLLFPKKITIFYMIMNLSMELFSI